MAETFAVTFRVGWSQIDFDCPVGHAAQRRLRRAAAAIGAKMSAN
jgi:hypothetical protein